MSSGKKPGGGSVKKAPDDPGKINKPGSGVPEPEEGKYKDIPSILPLAPGGVYAVKWETREKWVGPHPSAHCAALLRHPLEPIKSRLRLRLKNRQLATARGQDGTCSLSVPARRYLTLFKRLAPPMSDGGAQDARTTPFPVPDPRRMLVAPD
jgi:hypothetical protein